MQSKMLWAADQLIGQRRAIACTALQTRFCWWQNPHPRPSFPDATVECRNTPTKNQCKTFQHSGTPTIAATEQKESRHQQHRFRSLQRTLSCPMWFSRYTQALDCLLKVKKVRQHIDKHHKTQISNKTVRAFDPNVCGSMVWICSRHVTWPTMCTHSWFVLVSKNFLKLRDGDYLVPLRIHF